VVCVFAIVAPLAPVTSSAGAQGATVVINEFMASNSTTTVDNTGQFEDWIELRNLAGGTVDLSGWTIRDEATTFVFPAGTTIGDYLLVFASGDVDRTTGSELHLPFKLSASGEQLVLADPAGSIVGLGWPAPQAFPAQPTDVSYGRQNDGSTAFYTSPSPGAANSGGQSGIVAPVEFSVDHGFYTSTQQVVLDTATPSATIRYTTDGSTPSASNGTALQPGQSISISSTTTLRAAAVRNGWITSTSETRTYLFADDVIRQPASTPSGWPSRCESPCDQVMIYGMDQRVVDGNASAVINSLQAIPSISITTDLPNLFDANTGIYRNAAEARGASWQEVPASIELIDPSGAEPGFEINGGLRIRGGYSRSSANPKHSFRLFFRDDYGDGALDYSLFGAEGDDRFEKVDLRTSQNFSWAWGPNLANTLTRELVSRDTQGAMGQPYTRSRHYHLYLNGQYWGLYMTQERVSGEFGESYLGGDEDDFDVLKRNALAPGQTGTGLEAEATDGTVDDWQQLWPLVNDLSVSDQEFATLANEIDLVNLADFYLLHFYTGDTDASPSSYLSSTRWSVSNNWYVLRNRNRVGNAAKWLFFDHDSEHSLCAPSASRVTGDRPLVEADNTPPWNLGADYSNVEHLSPAWLHEALATHPSYRQIFADRVQLHMLTPGGALTVPQLQARLDARVNQVEPAILALSARWGDGPKIGQGSPLRNVGDWQNAISTLRDCLADRRSIVTSQLQNDGLWPSGPAPTISPAPGPQPWGSSLAVQASGGGTIWITTDGTDPRGVNGAPSGSATAYNGALTLSQSTTINARVLDGTQWSPLATARYTLSTAAGPASILVNEFNAVSSGNYLGGGTIADVANGVDATFGRVVGNGGDWFELAVVEDGLDARGIAIEISNTSSGIREIDTTITLPSTPELADLRAGSLITVSEDLPTDLGYAPYLGDWHLNIQADSFAIDNNDTQLAIFDATGIPIALPTGEGMGAYSINSREVFKFEGTPAPTTAPDDAGYNDGTSSSWGLPNEWDSGQSQQDLDSLRLLFGDVDCSGAVNIADAYAVARYSVGLITAAATCVERGPNEIFAAAGDVDGNAGVNIGDAAVIARCAVGLNEPVCPTP